MEYDPYDMAILGKVIEIVDEENAKVDFGGVKKVVKTTLVDVKVGDYVLVHAGYAIKVIKEDEINNDLIEKIKMILSDNR
ncbi:MAG: HypC/HybG/HupF family hydrogenase formation chaperone [Sulfolobaceae archaeon]|jgi:hydrogenase expression/formation protein HypC|nr:HypC/HybG/HupF family hydrogenase formation chaperone [Sulfolobaceae archaeon]